MLRQRKASAAGLQFSHRILGARREPGGCRTALSLGFALSVEKNGKVQRSDESQSSARLAKVGAKGEVRKDDCRASSSAQLVA